MVIRENHRFEVRRPLLNDEDEGEVNNADQGRRQPQTFQEMQRGIAPEGNHRNITNQRADIRRIVQRNKQIEQKLQLWEIANEEQQEIVDLHLSRRRCVMMGSYLILLVVLLISMIIVALFPLTPAIKNIILLTIGYSFLIIAIMILIQLCRNPWSSEDYKQKQRQIDNIWNEIKALQENSQDASVPQHIQIDNFQLRTQQRDMLDDQIKQKKNRVDNTKEELDELRYGKFSLRRSCIFYIFPFLAFLSLNGIVFLISHFFYQYFPTNNLGKILFLVYLSSNLLLFLFYFLGQYTDPRFSSKCKQLKSQVKQLKKELRQLKRKRRDI